MTGSEFGGALTVSGLRPETFAERALVTAAPRGGPCDLGETPPTEPSDSTHIRAAFLRAVVLGETEDAPATPRGVLVSGAYITGALVLDGCVLDRWLALRYCTFEDRVDLNEAQTRTVSFEGSAWVDSVEGSCVRAVGSEIRGNLVLAHARAKQAGLALRNIQVAHELALGWTQFGDAVDLAGAQISGTLTAVALSARAVDMTGARFERPVRLPELSVEALAAPSARFDSDLIIGPGATLNELTLDRVVIDGALFVSAAIDGHLRASQARVALNVDLVQDVRVEGQAFFQSLRVGGAFRLLDARLNAGLIIDSSDIGGSMIVERAEVRGPEGGYAIHGDGARIGRSVLIRRGAVCLGEARFVGAQIEGDADFSGAHLDGRGGHALRFYAARIENRVMLTAGFIAIGCVELGAIRAGAVDVSGGAFLNPGGVALTLYNAEIRGELRMQLVHGLLARLGGDLMQRIDRSWLKASGPHTEMLENAKAITGARLSLLAHGDTASTGPIVLDALKQDPERLFEVEDVDGALKAATLVCAGYFIGRGQWFEDGVVPHSADALRRAALEAEARPRSRIGRFLDGSLTLISAKPEVLRDDAAYWPEAGDLRVEGLEYERLGQGAPAAFREREPWIRKAAGTPHRFNSWVVRAGRWVASVWQGRLFEPQPGPPAQPFERLMTVLRAMGRLEDAQRVGVLQQDLLRERKALPFIVRVLGLHWLWGQLSGYGYRVRIALLWTVLIIGLGVYVYGVGWRHGAFAPAQPFILNSSAWQDCLREGDRRMLAGDDPNYAACWSGTRFGRGYEAYSSFVYAVDVFLPIFSLEQESHWAPAVALGPPMRQTDGALGALGRLWPWFGEQTIGSVVRAFRIFQEISGYVLSAFLAAGLARFTRRD